MDAWQHTGACGYNRPCAHQYVGKSQSCMVISGRLIVHAPVVLLYQAPYHNMTRDDRYGVTTAMCCVYISRDTPTMYVCIMPHTGTERHCLASFVPPSQRIRHSRRTSWRVGSSRASLYSPVIRNTRLETVGKPQSCMISKVRMIIGMSCTHRSIGRSSGLWTERRC